MNEILKNDHNGYWVRLGKCTSIPWNQQSVKKNKFLYNIFSNVLD